MQAGQGTEPECLVPVGLAVGNDGQVKNVMIQQLCSLFGTLKF